MEIRIEHERNFEKLGDDAYARLPARGDLPGQAGSRS